MSDKRLDLGLLPDGFLIEVKGQGLTGNTRWRPNYMNSMFRTYETKMSLYRPALNYWHFKEYIHKLPKGLVVEVAYQGLAAITDLDNLAHFNEGEYMYLSDCDAVKILGVTPEYKYHGEELGMEVIEI